MELHVCVEEPSSESALRILVPKIVGPGVAVKILNFGCKSKLLRNLPARLLDYADLIARGHAIKILALIDRDQDDCLKLKTFFEAMAMTAGPFTKTRPHETGRFSVANRIVAEELEAWFLGGVEALTAALPKLRKAKLKPVGNPDNIRGGTWEALHRRLKEGGIYPSTSPKIEAARPIAQHLEISRNRSRSFRFFVEGARALTGQHGSAGFTPQASSASA